MSEIAGLGWPTYSEDFVISELLNSSNEFQNFYRSERSKIVRTVVWANDTTLPAGIDHRTTRWVTGEQIIRLRRVPAVLEDASKIAHELEHLVLDTEGYPRLGAVNQLENLASAISSMVADLIVDLRLAGYGFNIGENYHREIAEHIRQLSADPRPPVNRTDELRWMVNYTSAILYRELVSVPDAESDFQVWFDPRYPEIAKRGQKLLAMVKRIGYDMPEKQRRLFREIMRRHHFERILTIL